ncbi:MAG: hypothetical protein ACU0BF_13425 [Paracoccaceae bacterium]
MIRPTLAAALALLAAPALSDTCGTDAADWLAGAGAQAEGAWVASIDVASMRVDGAWMSMLSFIGDASDGPVLIDASAEGLVLTMEDGSQLELAPPAPAIDLMPSAMPPGAAEIAAEGCAPADRPALTASTVSPEGAPLDVTLLPLDADRMLSIYLLGLPEGPMVQLWTLSR